MNIKLWNGNRVTLLGQCVPYEFKVAFWENKKFNDRKLRQSHNCLHKPDKHFNEYLKQNLPAANFLLFVHLKQDEKEKWLNT